MNPRYWQMTGWRCDLCALGAGCLLPLSLAPFDVPALGIVSAALLAWLLRGQSITGGMRRCFLFGLGMYGVGASWVYVSLAHFGLSSAWLAGALTAAFVFGMALVFALPFYIYCRWFIPDRPGHLLAFAAVWVLGEWVRTWLLTGFPWLYLGYAHLDTWLSGWAPVLGVFGLSFFAVFTGTGISYLVYDLARLYTKPPGARLRMTPVVATAGAVVLVWLAGLGLQQVRWTQPAGPEQTIAIVQANIPQELKWQPFYRDRTMEIYRELTDQVWDSDLIVWPEAAIPILYHDAEPLLRDLNETAAQKDTALVTGILYDDASGDYYNSIIGMGEASGIYHKQRLVPFGEYVPLGRWLHGLLDFFNLPVSVIARGPSDQAGLTIHGQTIAPYICYEVVYPDLVGANAWDSDTLITISNDAWFGKSIGPPQHFQMARMRALENGRYMIRSTNNGISGIIDPLGEVQVRGGRFTREVITGTVRPMAGHTPFAHWLSLPVVIGCFAILAAVALLQRRQRRMRQLGKAGVAGG